MSSKAPESAAWAAMRELPGPLHALAFVFLCFMCILTALRPVTYLAADQILANVPEMSRSSPEYPQTASFIGQSDGAVRAIGGTLDGISCSVPPFITSGVFSRRSDESTIDLQMRQACAFHDYCYRHGRATYNLSQADCDFMLQQHAFRLCRFNARSSPQAQQNCETRARLVVLGVRAFGFESFRTAGSTYFEYDQYPQSPAGYEVYRLADASLRARLGGAFGKSVYRFSVSPSGILVRETAFLRDGTAVPEAFSVHLAGRHERLLTAPLVATDSSGQSVFVWWQRTGLNNTGGRFFAVAPALASTADWQHFSDDNNGQVSQRGADKCRSPEESGILGPLTGAWAISDDIDCNFGEVHVSRLRGIGNSIRLFALRTTSCAGVGATAHCYMDLALGFNGNSVEVVNADGHRREGIAFRTGDYGLNTEAKPRPRFLPREADRYRAFVTPPELLEDAGTQGIYFFKRGNYRGERFQDELILRRAALMRSQYMGLPPQQHTAVSLGRVILESFSEMQEPPIVLNTSDGLLALGLNKIVDVKPGVGLDFEIVSPFAGITAWKIPGPRREPYDYEEASQHRLRSAGRVAEPMPVLPCTTSTPPIRNTPYPVFVVADRDVAPSLLFWSIGSRNGAAALDMQLVKIRNGSGVCYETDEISRATPLAWIKNSSPASYVTMIDDMDGDGQLDAVLVDRTAGGALALVRDATSVRVEGR